MKTLITIIICLVSVLSFNAQCPAFQNNLVELGVSSHYKDLSTIELQDNSHDMVIAGTRFSNNFNTEQLFLARVEEFDGSRVWAHQYTGVNVSRGFDIIRFEENGQERIAVTGYVDGGQFNKMYIAIIDAANGDIIIDESYAIDPNFNSQGLNIIYTTRNFNGSPMPGFVVAGYYNFNYDVNFANNSAGFVIRTDLNLGTLWTKSSFSQTSAAVDHDMMNDVLETNDGFFVTGSVNEPNGSRQGVLVSKFDDQGNSLWTNSYLQGNFRDVGIDSYYDAVSNEIYLLTYYSDKHYFGLTTIDNATGSINLNKSWYYVNASQLNRTGFKIFPSIDPLLPNDLVIMGYERDAVVQDPSGPLVNANTVPFSVSINRITGAVSRAYSYLVPYEDNVAYTDYFKFWDSQSPLIFHPEIAQPVAGGNCYFMVANRSYGASRSAIEMLKIDQSLINMCQRDQFSVNETLINFQGLPCIINNENGVPLGLGLAKAQNGLELENCERGGILAISTNEIPSINIFPNPASEMLRVEGIVSHHTTFKIMDVQGKMLKSATLKNASIDVSRLQTGVYFIEISEENTTRIKKFIKN